LKKKIRAILAKYGIYAAITIVLVLVTAGITKNCTNTTDIPAPAVSPAEVADQLITKEEEKAAAKSDLAASAHENVAVQPSPVPIKPPEPKFSDTIIHIGESISLEQANLSKEVTLKTELGEPWRVWMRSEVSFSMRAYAFDTEVTGLILFSVYLQPEEKWDDRNYVILDFHLTPPSSDTSEWGATLRRFESKTQGREQFPPAYGMYARNFQKAEIFHLAKQALVIALAPSP
jgi:hypothetical protein